METADLIQLISEKGSIKQYSKGELIFNQGEVDSRIFYIKSGDVLLEKDGSLVAEVGEGELLGDKNFIEQKARPVGAKVISDNCELVIFTRDEFDNLDNETQTGLLASLSVFLSNRIYKLNTVLSYISKINNQIVSFANSGNEKELLEMLNGIIDLESYIVLKSDFGNYHLLKANMNFDKEIEQFIKGLDVQDPMVKVGQNYIFVKAGEYIFLLSGKVELPQYVITNSLLYANSMFRYLGEKIEKYKTKEIMKSIGEFEV